MHLREHLPTVLIAMVVAALTAGAPAIAHDSDMTGTAAQQQHHRRGPDADKLNGIDATDLVKVNEDRLSNARQQVTSSVTSAAVLDGWLHAGDVATSRWTRAVDFSIIGANACSTQTFVGFVPTQVGDVVIMASPSNLPLNLFTPTMTVQNANYVVIKLCNLAGAAIDPPNATFDMTILRP